MSYIEKQRTGETTRAFFVKKLQIKGKTFVLKQKIGKLTPALSKEAYIIDNLEDLALKQSEIRLLALSDAWSELTYNSSLPKRVEYKSAKIAFAVEAFSLSKVIHSLFATEFIFNSNNIEGSRIPKENVLEIIRTGDTNHQNRNEVLEVRNSLKAFEYILSGFKFNPASLKRLYYLLTRGMILENGEKYPRGFKKVPNIVGNEPTTPPELVEMELANLFSRTRARKKLDHPLKLAFDFHKKYEAIHPFLDANGRTGRLAMNKILLSTGYFPMIVFSENKRAYFNALTKGIKGGEKKYYQFMLNQMDKTYDIMLKKLFEITDFNKKR